MKLNLPILFLEDDYHELESIYNKMKEVIPGLKFEELEFKSDMGYYCGLYWVGRKPGKKKIEEMWLMA